MQHEQEILDLIQEECGEIVQIISKIRRFGYNSVHPNGGDNNLTLLEGTTILS